MWSCEIKKVSTGKCVDKRQVACRSIQNILFHCFVQVISLTILDCTGHHSRFAIVPSYQKLRSCKHSLPSPLSAEEGPWFVSVGSPSTWHSLHWQTFAFLSFQQKVTFFLTLMGSPSNTKYVWWPLRQPYGYYCQQSDRSDTVCRGCMTFIPSRIGSSRLHLDWVGQRTRRTRTFSKARLKRNNVQTHFELCVARAA